MTTYFIHMGGIHALENLKRLCLLDEDPDGELIVYDNAVWDNTSKNNNQHTLSECAEEISKRIDMEDFLREDFSVVVYVPAQSAPNTHQDIHEVPRIAALELLYVLQIQYDLLRVFWPNGKYPRRLHMIFGEYADFKLHAVDVFSKQKPQKSFHDLLEALWRELLPNETPKENYSREECSAILQRAENGRWTCLKELGLEKTFAKLTDNQKSELSSQIIKDELYNAVTELFREINKMNAGRKEKTSEVETVLTVDHMLLEKSSDIHELTRNETLLFFYVYSGVWQACEGGALSADQSRPDTLIKDGGTLPKIYHLLHSAPAALQKKYDLLLRNLQEIDPDRALRVPERDSKKQMITIHQESVKWLHKNPYQPLSDQGEQPFSVQTGNHRSSGLRLLFLSARRIEENARQVLKKIKKESETLERRIQDYATSLESAYNECKYKQLRDIEKKIYQETKEFDQQNIDCDASFLATAQINTRESINNLHQSILDAKCKALVWPQDISKAVGNTQKKVDQLLERMKWSHWLLRILTAAVFVLLFSAPVPLLNSLGFPNLPRLISLATAAGAALGAYLISEQVFLWRYKNAVEKLTDDLASQWDSCNNQIMSSSNHFQTMLLEHVPSLFAQYQYGERLKAIMEMAETRRSKITYHKKRLNKQMEAIFFLARDLDIHLTVKEEDPDDVNEPADPAHAPALDIQLDFSAVSDQNRELYGLTADAARELISQAQAQGDN